MKRVLLVAYYFPPIAASGSLRPLGFCRYLEQYGWRPQVITTDCESVYPPMEQDGTLQSLVPVSVKVERISHANPARRILEFRESFRNAIPFPLKGRLARKDQQPSGPNFSTTDKDKSKSWWVSIKDSWWDRMFLFPDPQKYWFKAVVSTLSKAPSSERPDVIWATGKPWTGLLVGMKLAKHFGVPFIADFRDPWQGNPYSNWKGFRFSRKSQILEKMVVSSAAKVITTTCELSDHFKAVYPDMAEKFLAITNGFDDKENGLIAERQDVASRNLSERVAPQPLDICHFGTVYGKRSPYHFLQAIYELIEEKDIHPAQIRVRFFGNWDVQDSREWLAKDLESQGVLFRIRPIPHHECLQEMARAGLLLVLQPDSPLQIPGKIYEYISLGKPILVIGNKGATESLVSKYELGRSCPNDVSALKEILVNVVARQDCIAPPSSAVVRKFHYKFLTQELASVLHAVC